MNSRIAWQISDAFMSALFYDLRELEDPITRPRMDAMHFLNWKEFLSAQYLDGLLNSQEQFRF